MDDFSLQDLQAALQSAQEQKSTARLSERNVVELVSKLQALGLLGSDLLHSISGREYITCDQLCREVQELVTQTGGRIAVVDLPAQTGVDLVHCERQAQAAVAQSGGSLQVLQGELISSTYFDGMAAEVAELLQDAGSVALGDVARRFRLGADLVQSVIAPRMGAIIQGRLEGGLLYTTAYMSRVKAQLRGALRGASAPVNLATLAKDLGLASGAVGGRTVSTIAEELAAEGAIVGILKAGNWVPAVYARAQQASVLSFFRQNDYIEYDMVAKLGIPGARAHLLSVFPDGLALDSAFVSPQLRSQLDAAVEEALTSGGWIDAAAQLPSALSSADAGALLAACPSLGPPGGGAKEGGERRAEVLAGCCAVSGRLLEQLQQQCLEEAREAAERTLHSRRASGAAASTAAASPGAKAAAGKAAQQQAAAKDEDSDDDWDMGPKGKKGKKGGRRKGGGKALQAASAGKPDKAKAKGAGKHAAEGAGSELSVEALAEKLGEWSPLMLGAGEDGELPLAVAALLRPATLVEYEKTLNAVFVAGAEARRRRRDALANAIEAAFQRLQLWEHGAAVLTGDEEAEAGRLQLQRHLTRGVATEAFDALLRYQQVDFEQGAQEGSSDPQTEAMPLTAPERAALLKALPKDTAGPASAAAESLNGTNPEDCIDKLEAASGAAGLKLRRLDKKAMRSLVAAHKRALQGQIAREQDPATALSLAVPLLFAQVHGVAVSVPGKALTAIIHHLKGSMPEADHTILLHFHGLVVSSLKGQPAAQDGDVPVSEQLTALLPGLKKAAGIADARTQDDDADIHD